MGPQKNNEGDGAATAARIIVAAVAGGMVIALFTDAMAARPVKPVTVVPQPSFMDQLATYVTTRWAKADRWTNGSPFDNAWRADHVLHDTAGSTMTLRLSNRAFLGEAYSSGEYRTKGFYGYGCYEARFRPIAQPGIVTSFFTFAGPYDNGGNGRHNEIDIEFLGRDTRSVQFNFWTNDDTYGSHNERVLTLGFDAATESHNYGFRWTAVGLEWYVDGQIVDSFYETPLTKTPKASESLHKIMMNVWPVDATAAGWAGTFVYQGLREAKYEWVRYDSNSATCSFTFPTQVPRGA